jgi:murein DD-endopeptidase MepM/ murein hydrolase activator NlpD
MKIVFQIVLLFCVITSAFSQPVEVQANYNSVGDVEFVAYNNTEAPLFLNIDFADLENTSFNEPLPYIKMLEPGFNNLFILHRDMDADVPRFNYQIKYYRSDPSSLADLDFPYLIPLKPGGSAKVRDVNDISGFLGSKEPGSWNATGFLVNSGSQVYACRTGTVVEIAGSQRSGDPQNWYHAWTSTITLLQADGTLICYRNIVDKDKNLKVGDKVFAGQVLGNVTPSSTELIILIFQNQLASAELRFIIPRFVTGDKTTEILFPSREYDIVHPEEIRMLEMTRREMKKILRR